MQAKKTKADLQDKDLLRYNRNIVLPEIDINGQLQLSNAKVAIVGLGGIGCPAATYLASSGVGNLCLIDFDTVSLSNLNRQVLYSEDDISTMKVEAAKKNLESLTANYLYLFGVKPISPKIDLKVLEFKKNVNDIKSLGQKKNPKLNNLVYKNKTL